MQTHTVSAPREELVLNYLGCTLTLNGTECFLVGIDATGKAVFESEDQQVHLRLDDALKRLEREYR